MGAAPEMPAEGQKKPWVKLVVALVVVIVIIAAVAVYFLTQAPVTPPPTNSAPTLQSVSASSPAANINATISFSATASDPDNDTLTYKWDFGDNSTGTGAQVTHKYGYAGSYIAVVTVGDGKGHNVTGDAKPVFMLVNPAAHAMPATPTASPKPASILSASASLITVNSTVSFNGNSSWTWAYDGTDWIQAYATDDETLIPSLGMRPLPVLGYNWGDGTAPAFGNASTVGSPSHKFATLGSHLVQLAVVNYKTQVDIVGYTVRVLAAAPPSGVVKNPDIFTDVLFGEPESLDPAFDYESAGNGVIQQIAETLIWYDREKADVFVPQLATKVPDVTNPADVSPDGKTWNFTLRPGVKFHFGTDTVTCAAVSFSLKRVLYLNDVQSPAWILDQSLTGYAEDDPATPVNERNVAIEQSISCPDGPTGLKVQFHLSISYPAFLATLAYTVGSVIDPNPAAYRVTAGLCPSTDLNASYCTDQIVGTGPYKLRVWEPNQQIILDRNDQYWRTAGNFKEVHIVKVNDQQTRLLMLKSGDADSISLNFNFESSIRDTSGNLLPGILEYSGNTFVVQFIGYNQNINVSASAPGDNVPATFFQDVHVRKAFSYAWKYTDFIQNVVYGFGTPLCSAIPAGMFGYDPTVPCYNYDLAKAQQEFQLALDTRTGTPADTYWDNGFTLTLYYNIGNTVRQEGAQLFQTILQGLNSNFVIRVQGLEWASFLSAVNKKVPPLFFLGWAPDYADPDDYVVPFLRSGQFYPTRVGYSNATLDALIDQQSTELNPTTRLNLLKTIQRAPYYDVPYLWLYQAKSLDVFKSWVQGFYNNPMYSGNYYYVLKKA